MSPRSTAGWHGPAVWRRRWPVWRPTRRAPVFRSRRSSPCTARCEARRRLSNGWEIPSPSRWAPYRRRRGSTASPPSPGEPRVYCIEHAYFDRAGLYGESGGDYADNLQRYAFFCRAALEILHRITRTPCILHCHDWHTSLAPVYLRTYHRRPAIRPERPDRADGAQRRVPGAFPSFGHAGHWPAVGAVHLQASSSGTTR